MPRRRFYAALLGCALGGLPGPASAIVGRSEESSALADSIVMVLTRSKGSAGFCTGTVLSPTVVMTAAHCAPQGADLRIHYPDSGQAPVLLAVASVARHPGYRAEAIRRRERSVDLALIRLAQPLPTRFTAAALATAAGATPGDAFTLSGYGVAREGDGPSSGRLRSARLVARQPLSDLLLWARDPEDAGAGACTGDSGAPLTAAGSPSVAAIAVWSSGLGARQCGDLTQALWIAPQRRWIDDILRDWDMGR